MAPGLLPDFPTAEQTQHLRQQQDPENTLKPFADAPNGFHHQQYSYENSPFPSFPLSPRASRGNILLSPHLAPETANFHDYRPHLSQPSIQALSPTSPTMSYQLPVDSGAAMYHPTQNPTSNPGSVIAAPSEPSDAAGQEQPSGGWGDPQDGPPPLAGGDVEAAHNPSSLHVDTTGINTIMGVQALATSATPADPYFPQFSTRQHHHHSHPQQQDASQSTMPSPLHSAPNSPAAALARRESSAAVAHMLAARRMSLAATGMPQGSMDMMDPAAGVPIGSSDPRDVDPASTSAYDPAPTSVPSHGGAYPTAYGPAHPHMDTASYFEPAAGTPALPPLSSFPIAPAAEHHHHVGGTADAPQATVPSSSDPATPPQHPHYMYAAPPPPPHSSHPQHPHAHHAQLPGPYQPAQGYPHAMYTPVVGIPALLGDGGGDPAADDGAHRRGAGGYEPQVGGVAGGDATYASVVSSRVYGPPASEDSKLSTLSQPFAPAAQDVGWGEGVELPSTAEGEEEEEVTGSKRKARESGARRSRQRKKKDEDDGEGHEDAQQGSPSTFSVLHQHQHPHPHHHQQQQDGQQYAYAYAGGGPSDGGNGGLGFAMGFANSPPVVYSQPGPYPPLFQGQQPASHYAYGGHHGGGGNAGHHPLPPPPLRQGSASPFPLRDAPQPPSHYDDDGRQYQQQSQMQEVPESTTPRKTKGSGAPRKKRVYPCTYEGCGKTFGRSSHLSRHLKSTHTQPFAFACPVATCGKRFSRSDILKKHIKVHTAATRRAQEAGIDPVLAGAHAVDGTYPYGNMYDPAPFAAAVDDVDHTDAAAAADALKHETAGEGVGAAFVDAAEQQGRHYFSSTSRMDSGSGTTTPKFGASPSAGGFLPAGEAGVHGTATSVNALMQHSQISPRFHHLAVPAGMTGRIPATAFPYPSPTPTPLASPSASIAHLPSLASKHPAGAPGSMHPFVNPYAPQLGHHYPGAYISAPGTAMLPSIQQRIDEGAFKLNTSAANAYIPVISSSSGFSPAPPPSSFSGRSGYDRGPGEGGSGTSSSSSSTSSGEYPGGGQGSFAHPGAVGPRHGDDGAVVGMEDARLQSPFLPPPPPPQYYSGAAPPAGGPAGSLQPFQAAGAPASAGPFDPVTGSGGGGEVGVMPLPSSGMGLASGEGGLHY
ncbi:hypothetical protein HDU96_010860 [Phlyctochytrium bullatum]|nr:hypothetical protein HDU96_010860 [Phlyctochytrium bullatum]